jgi:hypothetical protein
MSNINIKTDKTHEYMRGGGDKKMDKTRPSPGGSATLYKTGTKKTGNDGNKWIVQENINGIKRWVKIQPKSKRESKTKTKSKSKSKTKSKTKEKAKSVSLNMYDFYNIVQITETEFKDVINKSTPNVRNTLEKLNDLVKVIRKTGKIAHIIPLPLSRSGMHWMDYPNSYMSEMYGDEYGVKGGYVYFTVKMNVKGTEIENEPIFATFTYMDVDQKKELIKLLDKHLPGQCIWSGKNTDAIQINLVKENINHIDLDELKADDTFPLLMITIDFNKSINLMKNRKIVLDINNKIDNVFDVKKNNISVYDDYGTNDITLTLNSVPTKVYDAKKNGLVEFFKSLIDKGGAIKCTAEIVTYNEKNATEKVYDSIKIKK